MLSVLEPLGHYRMVADLRACFAEAHPAFVRSVFLYGSASRFEATPRLSDLDVMVILHSEVLNVDQIATLANISERVRTRHPIHMTFRIRNAADVHWSSSGATDFGPSSLLNYLRDAWYLYGEDLDDILLVRLRSCDKEEARSNLRLRLSEIRKRARGLASVRGRQRSASNLSAPCKLEYEIGDMLVELAEVLCYQHGHLFSCTDQSLHLAREITRSELFVHANSWKLGQAETDVAAAIAETDHLVGHALDAGDTGFHRLLNSLVFKRIAVALDPKERQVHLREERLHEEMPLRNLIAELVSRAPHRPLMIAPNEPWLVHTEVRGETIVKHLVVAPQESHITPELSP